MCTSIDVIYYIWTLIVNISRAITPILLVVTFGILITKVVIAPKRKIEIK